MLLCLGLSKLLPSRRPMPGAVGYVALSAPAVRPWMKFRRCRMAETPISLAISAMVSAGSLEDNFNFTDASPSIAMLPYR
jgi:hypothetical protein